MHAGTDRSEPKANETKWSKKKNSVSGVVDADLFPFLFCQPESSNRLGKASMVSMQYK
jgi:hypothetical protein